MSRITTYDTDTVSADDKFIGTDENGATKNFTAQGVADFVNTSGSLTTQVPNGAIPLVQGNQFQEAGIFTTETTVNNVSIASPISWRVATDSDGFIGSLVGTKDNLFPYTIASFIGKNFTSTDYTTAANQTIVALGPTPFTIATNGDITWNFRLQINTPTTADQAAGTTGRALANVVISSLERRDLVINQAITTTSNLILEGLPTAVSTVAGTLYTQTGTQLGLTGAAAALKFVIQA